MPWRLILFIIIFAIFLVFITFNLDNRCDLTFGIIKFKQVPVFITVFTSFFFGLLCSLPFVLFGKSKRKEKTTKEKKGELDADSPRSAEAENNMSRREKFMREHGGESGSKSK
ncbi:MAG: hypothetical protein LBQ82_08890 [Treponema sp.]|jgi:uncharacterized integral membrane protein|nr:hypothetical protein [Treponema sp.]